MTHHASSNSVHKRIWTLTGTNFTIQSLWVYQHTFVQPWCVCVYMTLVHLLYFLQVVNLIIQHTGICTLTSRRHNHPHTRHYVTHVTLDICNRGNTCLVQRAWLAITDGSVLTSVTSSTGRAAAREGPIHIGACPSRETRS